MKNATIHSKRDRTAQKQLTSPSLGIEDVAFRRWNVDDVDEVTFGSNSVQWVTAELSAGIERTWTYDKTYCKENFVRKYADIK